MLQVEHPVTEGISNVNIPAAQLMIGMGIPLWAMPSMRQLYGLETGSEGPFSEQRSLLMMMLTVALCTSGRKVSNEPYPFLLP